MPVASWLLLGGAFCYIRQLLGSGRLLNISALARERKPSAAALMAAWVTQAIGKHGTT